MSIFKRAKPPRNGQKPLIASYCEDDRQLNRTVDDGIKQRMKTVGIVKIVYTV